MRKQIVTGSTTPLEIKIVYLSDEKLTPENETALLERVRQSLDYEQATINLERVGAEIGEIDFNRNQAALPLLGMMQLDFAGRMMRENPIFAAVRRRISAQMNERAGISGERMQLNRRISRNEMADRARENKTCAKPCRPTGEIADEFSNERRANSKSNAGGTVD